jgi:putative transposase
MKQIIVAKLKLHTTLEQYQALRETQIAYRNGLNYISRYAFEHGKSSNQQKLHKACYQEVRSLYQLPSQLACSIARQVSATYKGLWTKVKKNAQHRQAGYTKKRYKGLDKAPHYSSPTVTYVYGRDYGLKPDQKVSVLTLQGRIVIPYIGYSKHTDLLKTSKTIGEAKLYFDKPHKQFYLLVSIEFTLPDPTPTQITALGGMDVGQRFLAVVETPQQHSQFYSGKEVVHKANQMARRIKKLRQKGTRSAKRTLQRLQGRERRLKQDVNHVVSKRIVTSHPHTLIGMENLTDIRERIGMRTGKKASKKQRRANTLRSKWSFAEFQNMVAYKAVLNHSLTIKVDAHYTSQTCPKCGHTSPDNRPNKGLLFICQGCRYTLHADLVGARNITLRTLLIRQAWVSTGQLSTVPNVSNEETKAARLKRYAELRWSSDTSSHH